jgi:class 3 adenylate cyclase/tetratricopeptide (TPR) repeat protein
MRCDVCGVENPLETNFCGECGTQLRQVCGACDSSVPLRIKFCNHCGAAMANTAAAVSYPFGAQSRGVIDPEHRQLTVMFCDLAGSTSLSERLDPEELRDVIASYYETCSKVVHPRDGYIAQYLGDGLLVYFGYPTAHEDDPYRAVDAGLGIVSAMAPLSDRLQARVGHRLDVRIGIHTGPVVAGFVGDGTTAERLALGRTPNIAARLQSLAAPNTVIVSSQVHRLLQGFFEFEHRGNQQLRGVAEPERIYRVLHRIETTRFTAVTRHGLSPLIGRDEEIAELTRLFACVQHHQGKVVKLTGEPGVGKSRLLHFVRELAAESSQILSCQCSSSGRESAFQPVIDLLKQICSLREQDSAGAALEKIEHLVESRGLATSAVPLLAELLLIPFDSRYAQPEASPQQRRAQLIKVLTTSLLQPEANQPVVLLVEDLHWADPSSAELFAFIAKHVEGTRTFVVMTSRSQPDSEPDIPGATEIAIKRLTPSQAESLVNSMTRGKALPVTVMKQVVQKTDGVPLFVEELTKAILESGQLRETADRYEVAGDRAALQIPASLQDSLTARLDRLGPVKAVAQLSSVLGRRFRLDVLRELAPMRPEQLESSLGHLEGAGMVVRQEDAADGIGFIFKHALIQEAAYQSLLRSTRRSYHHKIANILLQKFQSISAARPELVAHHFAEAADHRPAAEFWLKAGRLANERAASREATANIHRGLQAVAQLADDPEAWQMELALQIALGPALQSTTGYTSLEVGATYARAAEICERIGNPAEYFWVAAGQGVYHQARGELREGLRKAELCVRIAAGVPELEFHARFGMATSHFWLGNFDDAREFLQQHSLFNELESRSDPSSLAMDTRVGYASFLSIALWVAGRPVSAFREADDAMTRARSLGRPYTLSMAMTFKAWLLQAAGDVNSTRQVAEEAVAFSTEHDVPFWRIWSHGPLGWALACQGFVEQGLGYIREALQGFRVSGTGTPQTYLLFLLADALLRAGQFDACREALIEAFGLVERTDERLWEAELWRLRAELALNFGDGQEIARGFYEKAIAVARHQGAIAFELRASLGLARHWESMSDFSSARELLTRVLAMFPEESHSPDLREARSRLVAMRSVVVPILGSSSSSSNVSS